MMKTVPLLVQYQTLCSVTDELFNVKGIGMGYIIRAANGELIVIDGGNTEDGESLLSLIKELAEVEVPVISYWFITHPHGDHYGALHTICEKASLLSQIEIKHLLFSVPSRDFVDVRGHVYQPMVDDLAFIQQQISTAYVEPAAGDIYETADIRAEVVTTWKDLHEIVDPNDTSMILMFEVSGTRILILGDAYDAAATNAVRKFGERLKCDICQIAHHGLRGGTIELYQLAEPTLYLLPSNRATMQTFRGKYPANAWVYDHAEDLRIMGDGMVILPLPLNQ